MVWGHSTGGTTDTHLLDASRTSSQEQKRHGSGMSKVHGNCYHVSGVRREGTGYQKRKERGKRLLTILCFWAQYD
jgi:hypothetical protein